MNNTSFVANYEIVPHYYSNDCKYLETYNSFQNYILYYVILLVFYIVVYLYISFTRLYYEILDKVDNNINYMNENIDNLKIIENNISNLMKKYETLNSKIIDLETRNKLYDSMLFNTGVETRNQKKARLGK